jgi:hypothetical protein
MILTVQNIITNYKLKKILIFLFVFVSTFLKGQHINKDVVVLSQPLPSSPILGYNGEGLVVFKLDSTERPSLKLSFYDVFTSLDSWARYAVYDFKEGYLPVQGKHGWYWINRDGRIVKKFGNLFLDILKPTQNVYPALRYNKNEDSKELVYLDSVGRVIFENVTFDNINQFRNDIAILRSSKDKTWYLANKKSRNLTPLHPYLQKRLKAVTAFENGLCKAVLKNGMAVFLTESGEIKTEQTDLKNGFDLYHIDIFNKYIIGKSREFVIKYDFDGNLIKKFPFYFEYLQVTDKYILTSDGSMNRTLLSHEYDKINLTFPDNQIFVADYLTDSLIGGVLLDTVNHTIEYRLLNADNFSEERRTSPMEHELYYYHSAKYFYNFGFTNSRLFLGNKVISRNPVFFADPSRKIYTHIPKFKIKIPNPFMFQIHGSEPLKYLKYFPNTSYLQIYQYKEKHFPKAMEKLKGLTEIYLKDCPALSYIPFSWMTLPNLTKATFYGCPNIQGLNTFIERNTNLTHFETDTHYFDPAFYDDMKKSRPNLNIYINGVLQ